MVNDGTISSKCWISVEYSYQCNTRKITSQKRLWAIRGFCVKLPIPKLQFLTEFFFFFCFLQVPPHPPALVRLHYQKLCDHHLKDEEYSTTQWRIETNLSCEKCFLHLKFFFLVSFLFSNFPKQVQNHYIKSVSVNTGHSRPLEPSLLPLLTNLSYIYIHIHIYIYYMFIYIHVEMCICNFLFLFV